MTLCGRSTNQWYTWKSTMIWADAQQRLPQFPASVVPGFQELPQNMLLLPDPSTSRLLFLPPPSHPHPSHQCTVTAIRPRKYPQTPGLPGLHAPYIYHHTRPLRCDFEKLMKSFLHQSQKERQHAEILIQVQNRPRGQSFWPLIERAEGSGVCILLGGDRTWVIHYCSRTNQLRTHVTARAGPPWHPLPGSTGETTKADLHYMEPETLPWQNASLTSTPADTHN